MTQSHSSSDSTPWSPRHLVGDAAMVLTLIIAIVRVIVSFRSVTSLTLLTDVSGLAMTDVGPTGTAITDGLCIVALMLAMIDRHLRGGRAHVMLILLWFIGAVVVAWHVVRGTGDAAVAGNWIGSLALGLAALHLADVPWRKRLAAGALAGLIVGMGLFAVHQYFIQHPRDVAYYQQHAEEILIQHGWQPGGMQQTKYETRLMQREATGRIGLSNVFGTVIGALTLTAAGLCIGVWRTHRRLAVSLAAVTALGMPALALTWSKGAAASIAAVAMALAVADTVAERSRNWPWRAAVFGVIYMAIAAVIMRGGIGPPDDAQGERSILFRAMYWQASVRMLAEQPLTGVGPGRFQDRYAVIKDPLSPEDVSDPHNIFVTYLANLGLGGAAWCGLLVGMAWMSGTLANRSLTTPAPTRRWAWSMTAMVAVGAFGFQYYKLLPELLVETAALWAVGVAGFVLIAASVALHVNNRRWLDVGLLAAATMAMTHSQIEMGLTNTMAAPLLMVILGAAAAPEKCPTKRRWLDEPAMVLVLAVCIAWFASPVKRLVQRDQLVADVKRSMQFNRFDSAAALFDAQPDLWQRDAALVQLAARVDVETGRNDEALTTLKLGLESAVSNRASLAHTRAELAAQLWHRTRDNRYRRQALDSAQWLLELTPHNVWNHVFAADLADRLNDTRLASRWYLQAIYLNTDAYLDPDSQLPPRELDRVHQRLEPRRPLDGSDAQQVR